MDNNDFNNLEKVISKLDYRIENKMLNWINDNIQNKTKSLHKDSYNDDALAGYQQDFLDLQKNVDVYLEINAFDIVGRVISELIFFESHIREILYKLLIPKFQDPASEIEEKSIETNIGVLGLISEFRLKLLMDISEIFINRVISRQESVDNIVEYSFNMLKRLSEFSISNLFEEKLVEETERTIEMAIYIATSHLETQLKGEIHIVS